MTTINEASTNLVEKLKDAQVAMRRGIRFNPPHHTNMSSVDWAREGADESHLYTAGFKHVEPSLSVDSKARISQAEVMKRHTSDNSRLEARSIDVVDMDDKTLIKLLKPLTTHPINVSEEPTSTYIQQLEEQRAKDTETIAQLESDNECLQKRLKGAIARQDENRSETLHEQKKRREEAEEADNRYNALVLETNRRIEKLERSHEIEVRNLQNDIHVQDKALEKHAEDEQLIGMLLRKAGSYAERFAE